MQKLFLTFFYSGLAPKAPGTAGTVAGLIAGLALLLIIPQTTLFFATVVITVIAVNEINKYEITTGEHDGKEIVIDEVAGIWLLLSCVPQSVPAWILSFLFFRLYDIWKPSLIGRIDRNVPGGMGVMGDDLVAALLSIISVYAVLEVLKPVW